MRTVRAVSREAVYLRRTDLGAVLADKVIKRYQFNFFEDKACNNCENANERELESKEVSDLCQNCAGYKGSYSLASNVVVGSNKYVKVPKGDFPKLEAFLERQGAELNLKDLRPVRKVKPMRFTGTLKDFQEKAVAALIENERGILKSLPRSGKTVMASAAICELGLKAMIIASQRDWLQGFHETFVGSKTQKPLTNLAPERIGFARTLEDFKRYDVCLVTVQTFHSERGQALLRKIRDWFSVVVVDEVHTAAADKYLRALAQLNVRYAFGLSGTPSRKDMKMVLANNVLGPIVHTTSVERLPLKVTLVRTKFTKTVKGNVPWAYIVGPLERDKARQKLIAEHALRDREAGHLVMIPYAGIKAIKNQIALINKMAGRTVAFPFHGGVKKDERVLTIQRAREYKRKILVGQARLMSTGINIPRASMFYDTTISSNMENCEQRVSRILTPWDGKPEPIYKIFLDEMNVRKRCLSNEWWHCIKPKFKPNIHPRDETILQEYFKAGSRRSEEGVGRFL